MLVVEQTFCPPLTVLIDDGDDDDAEEDSSECDEHLPGVHRDTRVPVLRIEPFVSHRLQFVVNRHLVEHTVKFSQQDSIVGDESIFTMLHIDRCEFEVGEVVFVQQPFERHSVP